MTRINASIPPAELCNKHLAAEAFELMRIPNTIESGKARLTGIPDVFRLGAGHVKFFYDKLDYLESRYKSIFAELIHRNHNAVDVSSTFTRLRKTHPYLFNKKYNENNIDKQILIDRINERLNSMNNVRWTNRKAPDWVAQTVEIEEIFS